MQYEWNAMFFLQVSSEQMCLFVISQHRPAISLVSGCHCHPSVRHLVMQQDM